MSFGQTVLLGAIAGLTIFLGLPVARVENASRTWQAFLNALATGVLLFLFWDILSKANEPISAALDRTKTGTTTEFLTLVVLFGAGFGLGLLGLVYLDRTFIRAAKLEREVSPAHLSLMIAAGIGVHNFAEGLAIGQASVSGAIELATLLIIGFGLHNMTEGFGIAAPLTAGPRPSWAFLCLAGAIGGAPTFLGTVVGYGIQAVPIFVFCLALAAGSILYVVAELLHVGRRFKLQELGMWGIFIGYLAGYGTDLILSWAGV